MDNLRLNIRELVLLKSKPVDYIEDLLLKSYSHKPYLAQMPYDRNTRNPYKMCARYMALDEYEHDLRTDIEDLNQEFDEAMNLFKDSKAKLEDLEEEKASLKEEIEKNSKDLSRFERNQIDWEGDLEKEKMKMMESAYLDSLMDIEVVGYDPNLDDFPDDGDVFDGYGGWADTPMGQYMKETWDEPLLEIEDSLKELEGICSPQTSQLIDDYIAKLESLPINENNIRAMNMREDAIWELRQLQANTPEEAPKVPGYNLVDLESRLDDVNFDIEVAQGVKKQSKKDMINSKKSVHERNVALYEVANEKQNCADIFSESSDMGIDDYIASVDFEQFLNDDRTVKEDFLDTQRQVALDNGDPWFE